jgi:protein TonB
MLAYAANRPLIAARRPAPNTMLAIIGIHVAAIAVLMSAKMDLPARIFRDPPLIFIPIPKVPDPIPTQPGPSPQPSQNQSVDHPQTEVNLAAQTDRHVDTGPTTPFNPGPVLPFATGSIELPPTHLLVKLGPRLATPESELKPPYPQSKLLSEEEAVLNLKLTIDQNGRVIAVDPVGRVDAAFLTAARRHLLAHWRYKPASEDGRPISSSTVITLRFQLDG